MSAEKKTAAIVKYELPPFTYRKDSDQNHTIMATTKLFIKSKNGRDVASLVMEPVERFRIIIRARPQMLHPASSLTCRRGRSL